MTVVVDDDGPGVPARSGTGRAPATRPFAALRERGMGASVLVAALSSAFGVLVLSLVGYISEVAFNDPSVGGSSTMAFILGLVGGIFLTVSMFVAAVVTANTFSTIVEGRVRGIALLRLVGATARSQRIEVARQGVLVGLVGSLIGFTGGVALSYAAIAVLTGFAGLPRYPFAVVRPALLLPMVAVVVTTGVAAWAGSRRVIDVTPLEALGGAQERVAGERHARGARIAMAVLLIVGCALLAAGVVAGRFTPIAILPAFVGGMLSFLGLIVGSSIFLPSVLRAVGRLFGTSAPARLAAENALRHPVRSSRMAIGVVIGVTLVTMFAVASESSKAVLVANSGGVMPEGLGSLMDSFTAIMISLVAVSAVIAGVGLVNLLTIGVVQRRRELGLLRALGLSNAQVRAMVLLEAVHVTLASLLVGLLLGVGYGWVAAQAMFAGVATVDGGTSGSVVAPMVPWLPVLLIVSAMALLTLIAAVVPTRLATRVTPVESLAAD